MMKMAICMADAQLALARLQAVLRHHGPLALAVSGGVDSMTLASIACAQEPHSRVFHAVSPAVPAAATARVRSHARQQGWQLLEIDAGEFNDADYRANPGNRCYFCKGNLYRSLRRHTPLPLAAGTNTDDLADYRPGLVAASEQQVLHPLVEAGIDKQGVRALAALLGLHDLQELPASPCLSSRVTTGIRIDPDLLPLIDATEQQLRELLQLQGAAGDLRCRVRPDGLAIELPLAHDAAQATAIRQAVHTIFAGSRFVHLSANIGIEPYRRGSAFIRVAT